MRAHRRHSIAPDICQCGRWDRQPLPGKESHLSISQAMGNTRQFLMFVCELDNIVSRQKASVATNTFMQAHKHKYARRARTHILKYFNRYCYPYKFNINQTHAQALTWACQHTSVRFLASRTHRPNKYTHIPTHACT